MSRRFVAEPGFFESIAAGLERELGPGYDVVRRPRHERRLNLREPADLAVREMETGQVTLIKTKVGILEDDHLPALGTMAEMWRLRESNAHLQPSVVLVSTAIISNVVEQWLTSRDIGVIRGQTSAGIVPQLAEHIAAGSVAHR